MCCYIRLSTSFFLIAVLFEVSTRHSSTDSSSTMFVSKILSVVVALAAGSSAIPTFGWLTGKESATPTSIFESIPGPPSGWNKENIDFNKDEAKIELRIQLVHQYMDKFHEMAMNVC